ncbi:hypothetical protein [Microbulbifer guangxiensis]|uniref:hypothetical protein n=1 Tax=Microbulbifer guangxiensis TaxID=2904249 RepID=UPI001F3BC4E9|nr:hypothetical protein [Microbulbifer guangxiensis]
MNKIKSHIQELISKELKGGAIDNWHGIETDNIDQHLVTPRVQVYHDSNGADLQWEFWTVLEEIPDDQSGYTVFYDVDVNMFGLGFHGTGGRMFSLGLYGSFLETLNSM